MMWGTTINSGLYHIDISTVNTNYTLTTDAIRRFADRMADAVHEFFTASAPIRDELMEMMDSFKSIKFHWHEHHAAEVALVQRDVLLARKQPPAYRIRIGTRARSASMSSRYMVTP